MRYLESFTLPTDSKEMEFMFGLNSLDSTCNSQTNAYPFWIFPRKGLEKLEFAPITIFCGKNGSGKSTLLNVISEKLGLKRNTLFNRSLMFDDYVNLCRYKLDEKCRFLPEESEIITSDGVFDFLLDIRAMNGNIDKKREKLIDEYVTIRKEQGWVMKSLDDYEELKRRNEARQRSRSEYVSRRFDIHESPMSSNGESAYSYFTNKINENALYLLDEPENSLSSSLQRELAAFIENSARFFNCQFVISTHSPFLMSIKNARIYDLDEYPVSVRKWTEISHVRAYYEFFRDHAEEFEN